MIRNLGVPAEGPGPGELQNGERGSSLNTKKPEVMTTLLWSLNMTPWTEGRHVGSEEEEELDPS